MTSIVCTGDIVLDVPDPDHWLAGIAPALDQADIAIGHLEVPHSHTVQEQGDDVPAPAADPDHIAALPRAGFTAMTLAGNHIADCGEDGIRDTMRGLEQFGIKFCGAGRNLSEARQPAVLAASERNVGLLSYNCVGPEFSWATANSAGCAYLPVTTENDVPVTPAGKLLNASSKAKNILQQDVSSLRNACDLVIVALHKGTVHTPAVIEAYERELAHLAIDAGADIVISHHAHIVRGIEIYKGKIIYHGLGNGCVVTHALSPGQDHPKRAEWAERRKKLFGFEPEPDYYLAPFHPEAVNGFMARIDWQQDRTLRAGIVPVHVDPPGRPRIAEDGEASRIADYLQHITLAAGLPALELKHSQDMIEIVAELN